MVIVIMSWKFENKINKDNGGMVWDTIVILTMYATWFDLCNANLS